MEPIQFWRYLGEKAQSDDLQRYVHDQFPRFAGAFTLNRREFMKLMAASLALAGAAGCSRPRETIVPYVSAPAELVAGKPLFFATALTHSGYATGVLAESNMGRPTKIEGNPVHPASLGATDIYAQASVLELWDPDRSQAVMNGSNINTWDGLVATVVDRMQTLSADRGAGLHILTESIAAPTLAAQLRALLAKYPLAQWHQYQPVNRDNVYDGARLAFGAGLETRYLFDRAQVVLSLDADFLGSLPGHVRYARDFVSARRVEGGGAASMNRLYAIESTPSLTGAMAEHRLPMRAAEVGTIAAALAQNLGIPLSTPVVVDSAETRAFIDAVARDLVRVRGTSIVLAGDEQPPHVHLLAHAINERLGNRGATVIHTQPVMAEAKNQTDDLKRLSLAMAAGNVDTLLIAGNPVYYAPADLGFADALSRVRLKIHLGLYRDETAARCDWHVPAAHELETWGDARAFDGTVTLQQPLIAPLYNGKSLHQLLALMSGEMNATSYDIVRGFWRDKLGNGDFETLWRTALRDGLIRDSAYPAQTVSLRAGSIVLPPQTEPTGALEIIFRADPTVHDGRYANNAWLQELPKPLTQLTWSNPVLMSPALAQRVGLNNEDVFELRVSGISITAPAWIMPGHVDSSVTVTMGYGRSQGGRIATNIGFNAYALRTSKAPWFAQGLEIVKTGTRAQLATTQHHHGMEGRDIIRTLPLAQLAQVQPAKSDKVSAESLYPPFESGGHAWGMSINLNTCIGCNACTIACQAENNIPVVGEQEVIHGREMHWIRVDRYYEGEASNPHVRFQPVPCMHCEEAPCEVVCPTAASVHNSEGLNVQVYNRCIGTRFCSNNCPYKVRRFNFLQYSQDEPALNAQRNPEVTVRQRGVMEKCSYCIQRIANARIEADKQNRRIADGEVVTACQAVCPTEAIAFGDLNDPASDVNRMKASPLNYALLEELNTKPRTTYLAKVVNPNTELKP